MICLLKYLLISLGTFSMDKSPSWEWNPHILWKQKIYFLSRKCPVPVHNLSQIDPVHKPTYHFLKIHLIITLPFKPTSPKWFLLLGLPTKTMYVYTPLLTPIRPHATPISMFSILSPEKYWVFRQDINIPICSFMHSPNTTSLLGSNILLSTSHFYYVNHALIFCCDFISTRRFMSL